MNRLEAKVQQPLSNYGLKCKHTKTDLKAAFAARDKEQKLRKKLEIARTKGDTRLITQLETDLQKASVDASRTTKNLEQQMDKFEVEKLQDMKVSYGKCPKILYTKFPGKIAYTNSADQDQTAPSGAVRSGSTLFAIPLTFLRNSCIKSNI